MEPNIALFFHNTFNMQAHVEFDNISMVSPWDNINFALFLLKDHLASSSFELGFGLFLGSMGDMFVFSPPPKKEERAGASTTHVVENAAQPGRQAGVWERGCGVKSSARWCPLLGPKSNMFGEERQYNWATKPPLIARLISLSGLPSKCNITAFGASSVRYYFWRPLHVN